MQFKYTIELEEFVGKEFLLSGVDFDKDEYENIWSYKEHCDVMRFKLDGLTFNALEDANDGYRSMMEEIYVTNNSLNNEFEPIKVRCEKLVSDDWNYTSGNLIKFIDVETDEIVIKLGTEHTDSYYPMFINYFNPKNMILNKETFYYGVEHDLKWILNFGARCESDYHFENFTLVGTSRKINNFVKSYVSDN